MFELVPTSKWLFRLDCIYNNRGSTGLHSHPGCGIGCMLNSSWTTSGGPSMMRRATLGTSPGQAAEDPVEVVARIRRDTVSLSKERRVPVVAVGGDGFKRSLADMPTLIYSKAMRGLSSIRRRIRGSMDSAGRCLWFVFFAKFGGACIDAHLGVDGTPTGDIAMMMDP